MNLATLIQNAKNGDTSSESKLYSYLFVRFTIITKQRVENSYAEDIAQDACLTVMQKYRELDDNCKVEPWAYTILRNKIGNHLQKKQTRKNILNEHADQFAANAVIRENPLLKRKIEQCLKKLFEKNEKYYEILMMSKDGFTTNEICSKFNIKPGYLYVILDRCRLNLIECLGLTKGGKREKR